MPKESTRRIAIFSTAGGGGKTTTAMNLAAGLAEHGRRVLLVDLDPAASLLRAFGQQPRSPLYAALQEADGLTRWIVPSEFAGVSLLTSSPEIDTDERLYRAGPASERRLHHALDALCEGSWDFVLFDCGASASRLSLAALAVAHEHIVPIEPSPISIGSLSGTLELAEAVRRHQNPRLGPAQILITQVIDPAIGCKTTDALRDRFEDRLLKTQIPHSSALIEASAHFEPVLTYEQNNPASTAYRGLASELLSHIRGTRELTDATRKPRRLTIRVSKTTSTADDYLSMLDISPSATTETALDPSTRDKSTTSPAPSSHAQMRRPRMISTENLETQAFAEGAGIAAIASGEATPQTSHSKPGNEKGWKLSARLNRELLAELYGAADQLEANKATVSSLVEEALRLYMPLLRDQHNGGRPFRPRGPKARTAERKPLIETPQTGSWTRIRSSQETSNEAASQDPTSDPTG